MQKRWMKSVIAASKLESPALPFQRGARRVRMADPTPTRKIA